MAVNQVLRSIRERCDGPYTEVILNIRQARESSICRRTIRDNERHDGRRELAAIQKMAQITMRTSARFLTSRVGRLQEGCDPQFSDLGHRIQTGREMHRALPADKRHNAVFVQLALALPRGQVTTELGADEGILRIPGHWRGTGRCSRSRQSVGGHPWVIRRQISYRRWKQRELYLTRRSVSGSAAGRRRIGRT